MALYSLWLVASVGRNFVFCSNNLLVMLAICSLSLFQIPNAKKCISGVLLRAFCLFLRLCFQFFYIRITLTRFILQIAFASRAIFSFISPHCPCRCYNINLLILIKCEIVAHDCCCFFRFGSISLHILLR